MEKNPADRYATAKELADDLRRFLADEPIRARPASMARRLRKWSRRHQAAVVAATVCLLVTVAALAGSVGWVLGEQANRQREAEGKVVEALDDAAPRLEKGNPHDPVLIAAVERAEAQLDSGVLGPELQGRVRQLRRDLDMLRKMEEARLQPAAGGNEMFDYAGADKLYTAAFKKYGLDVGFTDPGQAAKQVRTSAIRTPLVLALYDWAFVRDQLRKASDPVAAIVFTSAPAPAGTTMLRQGSGAVLAIVADLADDDRWRQEMGRAVARGDRVSLVRLTKAPTALRQPPASLMLLSRYLRPVEREALLRAVQRQHPADFWVNFDLALTLSKKNPPDLQEEIRFWQAALALQPQSPVVHSNYAASLYYKGQLDDAIAGCREALRLKKDYVYAYNNLGCALKAKGRLDDAIAEWKKAIRIKPDYQPALSNLGNALQQKGLYLGVFRLYSSAFAKQPKLANDLQFQHRYNAACAAALAGCGKGKDANQSDEKERARMRRQALDWLRADLDFYDKQYKAGQAPGVMLLIERLAHAQKDPDFKGVRESLDTLPESEQPAWRKLWADMEQLLKQARASLNTTTLQGNLKDESRQQTHDHKLEAGITYVFDMRSAVFDTYLKLLDAKGTLLAENDDIAPNNLNSRIIFTPKESGTFRIVATSFQERGRGPYTLTITSMKQKAGDKSGP
jgi:tetratricopeptide (TPR) repeat protein